MATMVDEMGKALPAVVGGAVRSFGFEDMGLRVVSIEGEPWFRLDDICRVLGIANSRDAAARLDDDEKGVAITDTPGGKQPVTFVNESGLYSLILTSRKPEAKAFKRWVTSEVLPDIRRTGRFGGDGAQLMSPEQLGAMIAAAHADYMESRFGPSPAAPDPRGVTLPAALLEDRRLSPRDTVVFAAFARSADDGGWATISHEGVGAACGLSRSAVRRAIDRLVETGHLVRFTSPVGPQGMQANSYRLKDRPAVVVTAGPTSGTGGNTPAVLAIGDHLTGFLAECVERVPGEFTPARVLYTAYLGWCSYHGFQPETEAAVGRALPRLGLVRREGHIRRWVGIRVKPGSHPPVAAPVRRRGNA